MKNLEIFSEIGKLKKVMLHKPGEEVENLTPDYMERLLFDDIPYLKVAREEHEYFAKVMEDRGTEVVYLTEMLEEAIEDTKIKDEFVNQFLKESGITSKGLEEGIKEYLYGFTNKEMINEMIAGVRKNKIKYKKENLKDYIKDDYAFYLDPIPNLYFTRDPGAIVGNSLSLHNMKNEARKRETIFLKYIKEHSRTFNKGEKINTVYDRELKDPIEGGDVLILSEKVVAIGYSERTTPNAIEEFARRLLNENNGYEKVLAIDIPKKRAYMHLDTVFTRIDYDKFIVHADIENTLSVYELTKENKNIKIKCLEGTLEEILSKTLKMDKIELIKCAGGDIVASHREQWNDGSNTLAIEPGVVITYERNTISNELLDKKGVKVIEIPSGELSRGRGGPRCMSMPLIREKI